MYDQVMNCADIIKSKLADEPPKIALVLGSGLNQVAEELEEAVKISYGDLPGFPKPTVAGHAGALHIGQLGGVPIICLQGRAHAYEGHAEQTLAFATRTMWALGVETFILTNAAGSLDFKAGPGSLMCITDHINMMGISPLVGLNDERFGPRFPDMGNAWNSDLREKMHDCAAREGIALHNGVYIGVKGPNFETPAEIKAFRIMGAGCVGMSTIPEVLAARHCGMKVVGISGITNYGAGMEDTVLTHDETMSEGAKAGEKMIRLLKVFVSEIG